jgi:hypothetical protein
MMHLMRTCCAAYLLMLATIGWSSPAFAETPPRFTVHDNGTVTDTTTDLVWQRFEDGTRRSWKGALAYCENLALAGLEDWRLPNIKELRSLVDATQDDIAIDTDAFPAATGSPYWSSSTRAGSPSFGWYVSFSRGQVYTKPKTDAELTRCVRFP